VTWNNLGDWPDLEPLLGCTVLRLVKDDDEPSHALWGYPHGAGRGGQLLRAPQVMDKCLEAGDLGWVIVFTWSNVLRDPTFTVSTRWTTGLGWVRGVRLVGRG
jgi:hypothetical protein